LILVSLLFVPAAFTVTDDLGRGPWWVFRRLLIPRARKIPPGPAREARALRPVAAQ